MTTAQVVKTSVTVNNNSPIQDYVHPDDQTQPAFEMTPGFKPFTINYLTWVTTSQQLLERVAVIFLKDQLVVWIRCYFPAMILKTLFENTLYFQNALIEAIMAGK